MIKIGLGICYYNDKECLKRLIKSIFPIPVEYKDNIVLIFIDGRFKGYESKSIKSTDGSFELIEYLKSNTTIEIKVINTVTQTAIPERHKRQMYVDIAAMQEGCNALLIVDADDWFEPKVKWDKLFDLLEEEEQEQEQEHFDKEPIPTIFSIQFTYKDEKDRHGNYRITSRPRLWFRPELLRYGTTHYEFVRRGGGNGNSSSSSSSSNNYPPTKSKGISPNIIQMCHNPLDCRCDDRLEKRKSYEARLGALEAHP